MKNFTTIQELVDFLKEQGIKGSPFTRTIVGTIAVAHLGTAMKGNNNRFYFQCGDLRVGVLPEHLGKANYTITILTAEKDFGKMKAGESFVVAE